MSRPDKLNHWSLILLKMFEDVGSRRREEVSGICRQPIHSSNSPQKWGCWLLISGVSELAENNTGATQHKAEAFLRNLYPPAGIRWDLLPTAHSIPRRVSRIDIQQILSGNIRVYPPLLPVSKRLFFWHNIFLYSASLISVQNAILSLSLLKRKALRGRFAGSSLLLKRDKMIWDMFVESQAFVLILRFPGAISCL